MGLRLERPGASPIDVLNRPSGSLIEAGASVHHSANAICKQLLGGRDDHRQLLQWSATRRCSHLLQGWSNGAGIGARRTQF